MLYTDASHPGTWTARRPHLDRRPELDGNRDAAPRSGKAQYIVEAVDAAGNVAVSNNEGVDFNGQSRQLDVLSSSPNPSAAGEQVIYTATVASSVSGDGSRAGNVVFLDGGAPITACGGASGKASATVVATWRQLHINRLAPDHRRTIVGDAAFSTLDHARRRRRSSATSRPPHPRGHRPARQVHGQVVTTRGERRVAVQPERIRGVPRRWHPNRSPAAGRAAPSLATARPPRARSPTT